MMIFLRRPHSTATDGRACAKDSTESDSCFMVAHVTGMKPLDFDMAPAKL